MKFSTDVDTGGAGARNIACLSFAGDTLKGADVLDVGCWTGGFLSLLNGMAKNMTAVDVEPAALEIAKSILPQARVIEASVLGLPFEDGSFDTVTLWAVLEHLPLDSEAKALKELRRVLRPGGYLAINVPNASFLSKALDPIYFLKGHRHYDLEEMAVMLEEAGFSVERSAIMGGWLSAFSFILFCIWKYLVRKPQPDWPRYRSAVERDATQEGFLELYILARRNQY
jgi:SAM-dependent methyltransferase